MRRLFFHSLAFVFASFPFGATGGRAADETDQKSYPDTQRERLQILASEPQFWSRVGFAQDPTRLDAEGNPKFHDSDFNQAVEYL